MIIGFVIWSIVAAIPFIIGISTWKSKEPTGFFTGRKPPSVRDVKKYNHAVAILWFGYAIFMEVLGIPFLFLEQNAAGFLWVMLGVVVITIALGVIYILIENHYRI